MCNSAFIMFTLIRCITPVIVFSINPWQSLWSADFTTVWNNHSRVCLHWVFLITSVGFCLRGGGSPKWKLILLFIFELYSLSITDREYSSFLRKCINKLVLKEMHFTLCFIYSDVTEALKLIIIKYHNLSWSSIHYCSRYVNS